MRVFASSDLHVDHASNLEILQQLSAEDYIEDCLIVAGDVTHHLSLLRKTFELLKKKFRHVCYVPGNHDLWVPRNGRENSLDKYYDVLSICWECGVHTQPVILKTNGHELKILPLLSWYARPEDGPDSLYLPSHGDDPQLQSWSDTHLVRWPEDESENIKSFFLNQNKPHLEFTETQHVISFSHFLPRLETMVPQRQQLETRTYFTQRTGFNFSRVAGSTLIDQQIRMSGSSVHVYGHQHRNRCRLIDGVYYVSCCLGYERERKIESITFPGSFPMQIWNSETGNQVDQYCEQFN